MNNIKQGQRTFILLYVIGIDWVESFNLITSLNFLFNLHLNNKGVESLFIFYNVIVSQDFVEASLLVYWLYIYEILEGCSYFS